MGIFDKFKNKENKNNDKPKISQSLKKTVTFIENAGGCIITKSLLSGESKLKWVFRNDSVNENDNGWRAFGDIDTQEYIDKSENHIVVDFNTLANLEPSVLKIYDLPIGTDLEYHFDETGRYFTDNNTGERI